MPGTPMWRQIAEDLRQKIESGDLGRDGQALPSELELQDTYSASRNTIRDAVKWLVTRGLVVTRPGQGTFVVLEVDPFVTLLGADISARAGGEGAAFLSEAAAQRRKAQLSQVRVEIQQADGLIASELHLGGGETVVSRHQQRYIDGTPWSLQTSFYPMRFVERGAIRIIQADDITVGVVSYIEQTLGVKQVGRRDRLTVRTPNSTETQFFSLPDDGRVAVFELIQTGYDEAGDPFRVTITTYPSDRNQFVMNAGKVPAEELDPPSRGTRADG
jgi:GntR family transcriptional regulator